MTGIPHLWLFAIAALMLNITPGNDMLYVATRSSSQGYKAGIWSALGIMVGCMFHITAAMIGLSALIANSAMAFNIIKFIGAAYLIYLGMRSWMSGGSQFRVKGDSQAIPMKKIFWQGVFTNVLNPKVALFFLAFLPQFIDPAVGDTWMQIFLLGSWFNISGTLVNIMVALLFGKLGAWLAGSQWFSKWQPKITGSLLVALGIRMTIQSRN